MRLDLSRCSGSFRLVSDRAQITRVCCALAGTAAVPVLWWMGLVGGGKYDEHVANWTIEVTPRDTAVRVAESIEMDFGNEERTGIDRVISNELGAPPSVYGLPYSVGPIEEDLTAELTYTEQRTSDRGDHTVARLSGYRDRLRGIQRLVAFYDLPSVIAVGERFEYELIGADRSVDANNVVVYVDGVELESPSCRRRSQQPCELRQTSEGYEVRLTSLPADDSLTVGGTITRRTEGTGHFLALQSDPRLQVKGVRWLLWGLAVPAAIAGWNIPLSRWRRRNKARWESTAKPALAAITAEPSNDVSLPHLPPIAPWEGAAVFHHDVGLPVAAAWFAQQVADDVLTAGSAGEGLRFRRGPSIGNADLGMADELRRMFGRHEDLQLDPHERRTKRAVRKLRRRQASSLQEHRWWRRFSPGGHEWFSREVLAVFAGWAVVIAALIATNWSYSWPVAIALLILVPASTNAAVAWWMAPQLGLEGEATVAVLAPLQQMLRRADTSHVEAAHRAGLLPQYSAWAVAFNAANRWREAVRAADLPAEAVASALAPLEMGRNGGPWSLAAGFPSNELQPTLRPEPADA